MNLLRKSANCRSSISLVCLALIAVDGVNRRANIGSTFDEYLQTHLFEPLGMVDTFFEVPPEKLPDFCLITAGLTKQAR